MKQKTVITQTYFDFADANVRLLFQIYLRLCRNCKNEKKTWNSWKISSEQTEMKLKSQKQNEFDLNQQLLIFFELLID